MKKNVIILFILLTSVLYSNADRILIINSLGYNTARQSLINAITNNGHTVFVNNSEYSLTSNFVSTNKDPVNGYDWICFFGNTSYTYLLPQIKKYLNSGGKVFYQYEISCCKESSSSISYLLTGLIGRIVLPSPIDRIAYSKSSPGWESTNTSCCTPIIGNAYKSLIGVPEYNQFQATRTFPNAEPAITKSLNYGFLLTSTDFVDIDKGAIVGLGDVNIWYDGNEPSDTEDTSSVNQNVIDFFFPNEESECYLLPPGPISNYNSPLGNDTTICKGDTLFLDVTAPGAMYLWQDSSIQSSINIFEEGRYWVEIITDDCRRTYAVKIDVERCITPIPNIITPNNDGINDFFANELFINENWDLTIYNRWGNQVYFMKDYKNQFNGDELNDGVYYYHIEKHNYHKGLEHKGWFQILR